MATSEFTRTIFCTLKKPATRGRSADSEVPPFSPDRPYREDKDPTTSGTATVTRGQPRMNW